MLPNFLVIGAAKCGTTSVCELLGGHPDVFMCDPKEPCYFSHMDETRTRSWYESLFDHAQGKRAVGEGSTAYTHPEVINATAQRIRDALPECRLIYVVRNPVKRLESDWRMRRHEDWTPTNISDAALQQESLIGHGLYWKNLSVYRKYFPDRQILVLFFEDFVRQPHSELQKCFKHIGVDPNITIADASRPRNSAADFRRDGFVVSRLRRLSGFEGAKSLVPRWAVRLAKNALTAPEQFEVEWQPDALDEVVKRFSADSREFLLHCGKAPDFWQLKAPEA